MEAWERKGQSVLEKDLFGPQRYCSMAKSDPGRISMQEDIAGERHNQESIQLYPQRMAWDLFDRKCAVNVWKMNIGMKHTLHSLIIIFKNRQYFWGLCDRYFTCIISLNPQNNSMSQALLLFPFYRWRNWEAQRSCSVPSLTGFTYKPVSEGTGIWIQGSLALGPESFTLRLSWLHETETS